MVNEEFSDAILVGEAEKMMGHFGRTNLAEKICLCSHKTYVMSIIAFSGMQTDKQIIKYQESYHIQGQIAGLAWPGYLSLLSVKYTFLSQLKFFVTHIDIVFSLFCLNSVFQCYITVLQR